MKLELVAVPVTDVDRAKAFYVDQVGFNADHDQQVTDELRFVQLTPPGSACSITFGDRPHAMIRPVPGGPPGGGRPMSKRRGRNSQARGVQVSDVQDFPWGKFVFFRDPDGNGWALQQLPPRVKAAPVTTITIPVRLGCAQLLTFASGQYPNPERCCWEERIDGGVAWLTFTRRRIVSVRASPRAHARSPHVAAIGAWLGTSTWPAYCAAGITAAYGLLKAYWVFGGTALWSIAPLPKS